MKHFSLAEYAEGKDLEMTPSGDGPNFTAVTEPDSGDENRSGSESLKGKNSSAVARKSTGPRTQQGKQRSKRNSITHGIFSDIAVLKGESQADFDALLCALRNDRQPQGALEEILVNKLSLLWWRLRRVWIAEGAEIRAGSEFIQWDAEERNRQDAAILPDLSLNGGLVRWMANPEVLQGSLDLLEELKENVENGGFHPEYDKAIMTKLYGNHDERGRSEKWKKTLFHSYFVWLGTSLCSDEERKQNGYASPQKCAENFLKEVKEEIQRLERYRKERATIWARRSDLESLRRSVPEGPQLDRLLRYQTAILREIDRTLNQLERLQRMRFGQHVPPPINLNVTTSEE